MLKLPKLETPAYEMSRNRFSVEVTAVPIRINYNSNVLHCVLIEELLFSQPS